MFFSFQRVLSTMNCEGPNSKHECGDFLLKYKRPEISHAKVCCVW